MKQGSKERLEWILKDKGLSSAELADLVHMKRTQIWRYLKTKARITENFAWRIETALGVSARWLMDGVGEPYVSNATIKEDVTGYGRNERVEVGDVLEFVEQQLSDEQLKGLIDKALAAGRYGSARYLIERLERRQK